jgi:hypothetical protein
MFNCCLKDGAWLQQPFNVQKQQQMQLQQRLYLPRPKVGAAMNALDKQIISPTHSQRATDESLLHSDFMWVTKFHGDFSHFCGKASLFLHAKLCK